jgi:predicted transcriptional regulator
MIQHHLRYLDIDDLIILSSLLSPDFCFVDVAKTLGLTPPAVTHRVNKYRTHIPNFSVKTQTKRGKYQVSPETRAFCLKAKEALTMLLHTA